MKSKLLLGLLLLNLSACYSANGVKNDTLNKNTTAINNNFSVSPNNTTSANVGSNTNNTSNTANNINPIIPNVTITPSPISSQGYSGSSGGYSGGAGGVAKPLTKEEIITMHKSDVATKVISSFKGDKSRALILLKLFGFSTTDLQKAGYSKEDIDKLDNELNSQSSPSP